MDIILLDFVADSLYNIGENIIMKERIYMKLVMAIVNDDDGNLVISELNKNKFSVTKLATTGGFLKAGNMTLITGVEDEQVQTVIDIIKSKSKRRKQFATSPIPIGSLGSVNPYPIEIEVGGATIFVLDVDRFERV